MIIDFSKIEKSCLEGFKGGKGELVMRSYADSNCKIMHHTLKVGASIGMHCHDDSCEIIFMIKGSAKATYDGNTEIVGEGQIHYCPKGHTHCLENTNDFDIEYLAIVPQF